MESTSSKSGISGGQSVKDMKFVIEDFDGETELDNRSLWESSIYIKIKNNRLSYYI